MQGKEKENKMKKMTMIMIAVAMAVLSAQATTITYDAAGYAGNEGAFGISGAIDGWYGSHATGPGFYAINTIVGGSEGNEMQIQQGRWAYRDFSSDIQNITTVSMLLSSSGASWGEVGLGSATGSSSHSGAALWIWHDARDSNDQILINAGSTGGGFLGAYVDNKDYLLTATLNFGTQTIDASLENLTDGGTTTLNGISFRTPTTLAAAQSTNGKLSFEANTLHTNYDDVSVIPEPATLGLLGVSGAGLLFLRRKLS